MRLQHKRMKRFNIKEGLQLFIIRIMPILIVIYLIWIQNHLILNNQTVYTASDVDKSFVGYRIVHISDICNSNAKIIRKVKKAQPDVIFLTGGYADESGNYTNTLSIVNGLCTIAPVYYIYNNEDAGYELENTSAENITNKQVRLSPNIKDVNTFIKDNYGDKLFNQANKGDEKAQEYINYVQEELNRTSNSEILISGMSKTETEATILEKTFELIGTDATKLTMMLCSGVEYLDTICKSDLDMIFMGNTFGTNRLSEKYTKGIYGNMGTQIVVSGGIGTRKGIMRIFNFPQIQTFILSDGTIEDDTPLENFLEKFIDDVGTIYDNDGGFKEKIYTYTNEQ